MSSAVHPVRIASKLHMRIPWGQSACCQCRAPVLSCSNQHLLATAGQISGHIQHSKCAPMRTASERHNGPLQQPQKCIGLLQYTGSFEQRRSGWLQLILLSAQQMKQQQPLSAAVFTVDAAGTGCSAQAVQQQLA